MVVVVEHDEQLTQPPAVVLTVSLVDQDEAFITENRWQSRSGLNKVQLFRTGVGRLGRWS